MTKICIEIDGQNLKPLVAVADGAEGKLPLTTFEPNQNQATIRLFLGTGSKYREFYSFRIDNLHSTGTDRPRINVAATIRDGTLNLSFFLSGVPIHNEPIELQTVLDSKKLTPKYIGLIALIAVAIVALFSIGAIRSGLRFSSPTVAGTEPPTELPTVEYKVTPQGESPAAADAQEVISAEADDSGELAVTSGRLATPPMSSSKTVLYFQPDVYFLTSEAMSALDEFLDDFEGVSDLPLSIVGHCALFGTEQGRTDLSLRRAQAVSNYMKNRGRLPESPDEIIGMGGKQPVSREIALQHLNRRVEITWLLSTDSN